MQRLKKRVQFQAALAGKKVSSTTHFALHRCTLDLGADSSRVELAATKPRPPLFASSDVWLGAMVPKRWAKKAVTRNAIKRQIYNVSFEFESVLPVAAHVVRLRSTFDAASFTSASSLALKRVVRQELRQLFAAALPRGAQTPLTASPPC